MKITKDFNNFLMDLLLEDEKKKFHGVTELPFIISRRLKSLLSTINHPIAEKLIKTDKDREDKKVTFVDFHETEFNKFTLVNSNKAFDNIVDVYGSRVNNLDKLSASQELDKLVVNDNTVSSEFWTKNRAEVKIGSFVGKVFPKEYKQGGNPGNDIESFVQSIIAKRKSDEEALSGGDRFKIVKGSDIVKYYNEDMYDVIDIDGETIFGSSLGGSCMRYDSCGEYIDFYAENKDVSMLILMSDIKGREDTIVGRAIIWELSIPSGRTFMDRIYYRYESDMSMFKQYAEKQGWLYKKNQNMDANSEIVDTKSGESKNIDMKTLSTFKTTSYYPYMDTMKWFNVELKYLTNDSDEYDDSGYEVYLLEDTDGGYEEEAVGQYIEYYGQRFDEEDIVFCEYGDDWRTNDDAIWIEQWSEYATQEYVDDNFIYSNYEDRYLEQDDAVHSDYHNDYISVANSITLSMGADEKNMEEVSEIEDIRSDNEIGDSVMEYSDKNGDIYYFSNDDYEEYFVKVLIGENAWMNAWKHKIWDKDKLFKFDGQWHYEYDSKIKDKLTGQKRLWDEK